MRFPQREQIMSQHYSQVLWGTILHWVRIGLESGIQEVRLIDRIRRAATMNDAKRSLCGGMGEDAHRTAT